MEIIEIDDEASNEASMLLCCRACLATDCKLINIHDYKLGDAFARISGTSVLRDSLPQHLCEYCRALLLKCAVFRNKCLRTQQCLKLMLKHQLTMDSIRSIDRFSHKLALQLSLTEVQTINCVQTQCTDSNKDPIPDIIDLDSIIESGDSEIEYKDKNGIQINDDDDAMMLIVKETALIERERNIGAVKSEMKLRIEISDNNGIGDNDEIADINDGAKTASYPEKIGKEDRDMEVEILEIDDIIGIELANNPLEIDKENKVTKRKVAKKKKIEVKLENGEKSNDSTDAKSMEVVKRQRKRKKEGTRKFRDPANDFLPVFDFETFENENDVRVVTLTKEEQLQEIQARKLSANYLESLHRCEQCYKGFDAEAAFNNHRARHSQSAGPFACEICGVRFKQQWRRKQHHNLHRFKFVCEACGFVSRNRYQAHRHYEMHAGKTFQCQHCERTFDKSWTYLSHLRKTHLAMSVACHACGETFVSQVGLKLHKTRMHSEYKCDTCSVYFVSLEALSRHTDATATDGHTGRPCGQCGDSYANAEMLQAHVKETHPVETQRCEECSVTFASEASYALHYRRKHLKQPYSVAGRPPRPRKRRPRAVACSRDAMCDQCGHVLPNAALLRYHQRSHMAVKPFACPDCPKTFSLKKTRDGHVLTHTGERPSQCPLCPLAFAQEGNLLRHHKTVHLRLDKSLPCELCARTFMTACGRRRHVRAVHGGLPRPRRRRETDTAETQ